MFIYLHIPVCLSRCIYCDFAVVLEKHVDKDAYLMAVFRELEQRLAASGLSDGKLETLYIGGGTPSLLVAAVYDRFLKQLSRWLHIPDDVEITLEVNPGKQASSFSEYRAVGINRISVGVQSFVDTELKRLSRGHTSVEAEQCIRQIQSAGIENVSIDLMYGIPGQTRQSWEQTLCRTVALEVPHVSMYGLKVETGTPWIPCSIIQRMACRRMRLRLTGIFWHAGISRMLVFCRMSSATMLIPALPPGTMLTIGKVAST